MLSRWLEIEYRTPKLDEIVKQAREIDHGTILRWTRIQETLSLGPENKSKDKEAARNLRGFWVAEKLATLPLQVEMN